MERAISLSDPGLRAGPAERAAIEKLIARRVVSEADVRQARSLHGGRSLLSALNRIGVLTDSLFAECLSEITGIPVYEPASAPTPPSGSEKLNPDFLRETRCLLLGEQGPAGLVDPVDTRAIRGLTYALGYLPEQVILRAGDWSRIFARLYPGEAHTPDTSAEEPDLDLELGSSDQDAPVVRQVSAWLTEAADQGASDVHFDARRSHLEVRYRIDGSLVTVDRQPRGMAASVIARLKVIAGLDLGERNKAQDGRATIVVRGRRLDIRLSIIPTIDGEGAVIRLLDRPDNLLSLEGLGFSRDIVNALDRVCSRRHGIFIVAGPTGSGKTTTLYSCLERMKDRGLKILSIEDPVEYHFDHVNQVQVSERSGRTFAGALRAFLRHDPDVILVGEIRDSETAAIAIQAALSGHLVLATLHAIDTSRVRTRLEDMGVEPFRLDACLIGSLAQRLVRVLCPHCRQEVVPTPAQISFYQACGEPVPGTLFEPAGCPACREEGYSGRVALAELAMGPETEDQSARLSTKALKLVSEGRTAFAEIAGLL